jgi:soluble lytic murein transglycosylase
MMKFVLSVFVLFAVIFGVYFVAVRVAFPLKYRAEIYEFGTEYAVDAALLAGVIRVESGFDPGAVSGAGAVGLMQIMPMTAEYVYELMGREGEIDLLNPRVNIEIGAYYLAYLFKKFGDTRTVLAAYNAGEGNVSKWAGNASTVKSTPFKETNEYIERVLNAANVYKRRI